MWAACCIVWVTTTCAKVAYWLVMDTGVLTKARKSNLKKERSDVPTTPIHYAATSMLTEKQKALCLYSKKYFAIFRKP